MTDEFELSVEEVLGASTNREWLTSEPAKRVLARPAMRTAIYRALHPTPTAAHHRLLQAMLACEDDYRERLDSWDEGRAVEDDGEAHENLMWCALMLHQLGDFEDVLPMWRAKHISMDTGCAMDIEYLVGAGVEATLSYLDALDDEEAPHCAEYIRECASTGHFRSLERWVAGRIAYFGE